MQFSDVIKTINIKQTININKNQIFDKLSSFSKEVDNKTIFIIDARKKIKKKYINEAISKNIPAIISNKIQKNIHITQFIVKDLEKEVFKLLKKIKPNKPQSTIAITGTNGKTSVAWYISEICKLNNIKTKMQGTLGYYIGGKKSKSYQLTTPEFEQLYQNSHTKNINKYNYIFEASSHALHQDRIKKIEIDIAAITNITHDHLDYHKTFNNYKISKFKLFSKYLNLKGSAVINSRLDHLPFLIKILKKRKIKYYFFGKKNVYFANKNNISNLIVNINNKKYKINNLYLTEIEKQNIECAITCCLLIKISPSQIIKSINLLKNPPGRAETLFYKKKSSKIIIDYAHTPDALKNILLAYTKNNHKPSLIFGCGGNRDKQKRKKMGLIANKFAKNTIITDDNPRDEDPAKIRKDILKYCPNAQEISSRKKAIIYGIQKLKNNSVLIIAGKGHEKIQILKNKKIKFNDLEISKKLIK